MNKENIKIIIILIASVAVFLYTLTLFTTEEFNKEAAVENIFINCQTSAMQINSPDKFVEEQDMEHIASLFPPILDEKGNVVKSSIDQYSESIKSQVKIDCDEIRRVCSEDYNSEQCINLRRQSF